MIVTALTVYPVKSCGGVDVDFCRVGPLGLNMDRKMVLVDEKNRFMTQREFSRMALIKPDIDDDNLKFTAPGMPTLMFDDIGTDVVNFKIWKDDCRGYAAGKSINDWFSAYLGASCTLTLHSEDFPRLRESSSLGRRNPASFADSDHILIVSEQSLWDLNSRLKDPLPMNRFRPNIVVLADEAYNEDYWGQIKIGDVILLGTALCTRCVITCTDQVIGESKGAEPLKTLASYRKTEKGVVFGKKFNVEKMGRISIGDEVKIITSSRL